MLLNWKKYKGRIFLSGVEISIFTSLPVSLVSTVYFPRYGMMRMESVSEWVYGKYTLIIYTNRAFANGINKWVRMNFHEITLIPHVHAQVLHVSNTASMNWHRLQTLILSDSYTVFSFGNYSYILVLVELLKWAFVVDCGISLEAITGLCLFDVVSSEFRSFCKANLIARVRKRVRHVHCVIIVYDDEKCRFGKFRNFSIIFSRLRYRWKWNLYSNQLSLLKCIKSWCYFWLLKF